MVDRYNIVLCSGNLHNKKEISSFEKRSMFQWKVDHSIKVGCYLLSYTFLIPCSLFLYIFVSSFCNRKVGWSFRLTTYFETLYFLGASLILLFLDFWWHLSWDTLLRFISEYDTCQPLGGHHRICEQCHRNALNPFLNCTKKNVFSSKGRWPALGFEPSLYSDWYLARLHYRGRAYVLRHFCFLCDDSKLTSLQRETNFCRWYFRTDGFFSMTSRISTHARLPYCNIAAGKIPQFHTACVKFGVRSKFLFGHCVFFIWYQIVTLKLK